MKKSPTEQAGANEPLVIVKVLKRSRQGFRVRDSLRLGWDLALARFGCRWMTNLDADAPAPAALTIAPSRLCCPAVGRWPLGDYSLTIRRETER